MPGFDPEIGKLAQRVLINPRRIDYQTGVFASKVTSFFFFSSVYFVLGCCIKLSCLLCFVIDHPSQGWETSHH